MFPYGETGGGETSGDGRAGGGRGMRGYYLGSGDRQEAIARLRRWAAIAEEHLATEWIDQLAYHIVIYGKQ